MSWQDGRRVRAIRRFAMTSYNRSARRSKQQLATPVQSEGGNASHVARAPHAGLDTTMRCPSCGQMYRVVVSEYSWDVPGNHCPAYWRRVVAPCGHALDLEYDDEHHNTTVRPI